MYGSEVMNILVENATSFSERKAIFALTESESLKINNEMVSKLFNSALSKSYIDFDDIPNSKGDITRYKGYNSMVSSLELLRNIVENSGGKKIPEIEIVEKAVSNIVANRDIFEKGFKLNKEFIILQYNTIVAASVAATSILIASYVDYVKTINKVEFKIIDTKHSIGNTCINSLDQFNKSIASGEFSKVTNSVIKTGVTTEAAGAGALAALAVPKPILIGAGIILGVILLVKVIRHLVFFFYNSKQNLSDYLKLQSTFLEMNKNNLMANGSGLSAEKRNKIMTKQDELIKKLLKYSDKLKVDVKLSEQKADVEIKKENKNWTLDSVKNDALAKDTTGFTLI